MRRTAPFLAVAAAATIALTAAPAAAIEPYQPDAMINPAMVGWVGQDVIGTDGADQEAYLGITVGGVGDFELAVENDGAFADRFRFDGCASSRGYKVRYVIGGESVTKAVRNGTFRSVVLSSGGVAGGLHLRVKATADAKPRILCDVVVSSSNAPAETDTVRARVELLP
ncbi:MAG: hypothetical protein WD004_02025 [Actinomycetota bacterium]